MEAGFEPSKSGSTGFALHHCEALPPRRTPPACGCLHEALLVSRTLLMPADLELALLCCHPVSDQGPSHCSLPALGPCLSPLCLCRLSCPAPGLPHHHGWQTLLLWLLLVMQPTLLLLQSQFFCAQWMGVCSPTLMARFKVEHFCPPKEALLFRDDTFSLEELESVS